MFNHPKSGKLLSLPANFISEVIIKTDSIENVYKTTASLKFEKKIKDVKFYQILKGGSYQLIKMPIKVLIEADYKKVYGVDKRFDEFETSFKYFIMTSDSIFHPLQLNKKSLTKLFPDKKSLIESAAAGITNKNDEEKILYILSKF